jgi:hydroxyacylglutathione hydrolase
MSKPIQITRLHAFTDNYLWLIHNRKEAIVVDPGNAEIIISELEQQGLSLSAILVTHHHSDHIGGLEKLIKFAPNVKIYGPALESIPYVNFPLRGNEKLSFDQFDLTFSVIDVPGHTLGHLAYYEPNHAWLFCGDTLFGAGCGRVFEGTFTQMHQSLQKLLNLPDKTLVYCAHEYTLSNILFALQAEPSNINLLKRLELTRDLRQRQEASVPFQLGEEKNTNPFLRCHSQEIKQQLLSLQKINIDANEIDIFSALRIWKNHF